MGFHKLSHKPNRLCKSSGHRCISSVTNRPSSVSMRGRKLMKSSGSDKQRNPKCYISAQAAGRVGGRGHCGAGPDRCGVCGEFCGRWERNADAGVQIDVLFAAGGAIAFAGTFIPQAGEFVAAADAVAVAGFGCRLDGDECHCKEILLSRAIPRKQRDPRNQISFQLLQGTKIRRTGDKPASTGSSDGPGGMGSRGVRADPASAAPEWS